MSIFWAYIPPFSFSFSDFTNQHVFFQQQREELSSVCHASPNLIQWFDENFLISAEDEDYKVTVVQVKNKWIKHPGTQFRLKMVR